MGARGVSRPSGMSCSATRSKTAPLPICARPRASPSDVLKASGGSPLVTSLAIAMALEGVDLFHGGGLLSIAHTEGRHRLHHRRLRQIADPPPDRRNPLAHTRSIQKPSNGGADQPRRFSCARPRPDRLSSSRQNWRDLFSPRKHLSGASPSVVAHGLRAVRSRTQFDNQPRPPPPPKPNPTIP